MPTIITAGDVNNGIAVASGNDGALTLQTGPAGAKVDALTLQSDGTPAFKKPLAGGALTLMTAISLAAISTAFGAGDGSTTFNVPDCRGRVPAGKDNMGGVAASRLTTAGSGVDGATLGASGGAQTHTLTANQMPSHTHNYVGGANAAGTGTTGAAGQSANGYVMATLGAGFDQAHNNTQPTIITNYIIKT